MCYRLFMKKKFPIICPKGSRVVITQGFFPDGVANPATGQTHDAIDFVIQDITLSEKDNLRLTYGSQLVAPMDSKVVLINDFGTMQSLGNGIDIEWQEAGYYWRLHFWHTVYNKFKLGDMVKSGDIVALMGNTGDCRPLPTPESPYNGTHCHLRLSRYIKDQFGGNLNITSLDVRDYFDVNNPYTGSDSSVIIDLEPLKWAWAKLGLKDNLSKLFYMIKNIFN